MAHNWTRGTPKAPPLPTSGTYDGIHDGHPSALGHKFQRDWEAPWVQEDPTVRAMMYDNMQEIKSTDLGDPIDEEKVDLALHILKTATAVGIDRWSPGDLRRLPKKALRALAEILQQ
eukprot:5445562-Karenia_brevis.AAC.1